MHIQFFLTCAAFATFSYANSKFHFTMDFKKMLIIRTGLRALSHDEMCPIPMNGWFYALALPRYPFITLSVGTYISVHLPYLYYHSFLRDNLAVLSFPPHLDKPNHAQRCSIHRHDSPHTHTHLPPPPPPLPRADIPHDRRSPHATPSRTSPLLPSPFPFPQAPTPPSPPLTSPPTNPPPLSPGGFSASTAPTSPPPPGFRKRRTRASSATASHSTPTATAGGTRASRASPCTGPCATSSARPTCATCSCSAGCRSVRIRASAMVGRRAIGSAGPCSRRLRLGRCWGWRGLDGGRGVRGVREVRRSS